MSQTTVGVKLPPETLAQIEAIALDQHHQTGDVCTVSSVIRDAVAKHLAFLQPVAKSETGTASTRHRQRAA